MSKYTTEVRFICENYAGLQDSSSDYKTVIEKSRAKVFDFDFPIFDENYRSVLETKILKHFYTREIGFETVGLWKMWLDKRLNEIMPYYNQLYKSETLKFNPLYDFDYKVNSKRNVSGKDDKTSDYTRTDNLTESTNGTSDTTRTDNLKESSKGTRVDNLTEMINVTADNTRTDNLTRSTKGDSTTDGTLDHTDNNNTTSSNKNRYSDTPQGALNDLEKDKYLTNATLDDGSVKVTDTAKDTSKNITTYNDSVFNTGTQKNAQTSNSSKDNTGTQNNDVIKDNTGTQNNKGTTSGTKTNTGTQFNDGTDKRVYNNENEYFEHVAGKRNGVSYSVLLNQYRQTFLNIDTMIIDELNDLFMNLW